MPSNLCRFLQGTRKLSELLEGHREKLETIRDVLGKEFEKSPKEDEGNWGLIQGDFWSGNILVQNTPWVDTLQRHRTNKLFIIDWEFAQFGHRCYDLGQIVGDLIERRIYNDNSTGMAVMEGVIDGYGKLSDEMAFRTAIHVGVHVIGWYNRRPRKGPWVAHSEAIVAGLALGRDFIVKGWERDRKFFEGSVLAPLFTAKQT
ncbi:putative Aminoglycoside phosphotransferase domain-containing protein [Seiridium cardinale]|uniref:Aminoglycoside phosphotransferase domain-containing protein n=1 Tax=Seiridium cardinale TaxID=138064 RepID=A0ABR2XXS5_9PEZI